MIDIQYSKEFRVKFITVISKEKDYIIGFIFINDTDLGKDNFRLTLHSFKEVAERMQKAID